MRREVALAVEHLADPEYQRRVWVERTYPSPTYHDDLNMTLHTLYDDTGTPPTSSVRSAQPC
jgi:hypothetical protein